MNGQVFPMSRRNLNLDLIKCIACIGVVGLHSVGMINYTIYYLCGVSVPFFFMVNGYLMFSKESIPYTYAFKKALSLLRIVVLWNLMILIPVLLFRHKLVNPITLCLKSLLQQGYLWHFWFFGALMLLYLALPVLHHLFYERTRRLAVCCIVLALICAALSILSMHFGYSIESYVPQTLRLWTWLFYFLFGGLSAMLKADVQARAKSAPVIEQQHKCTHIPLPVHGITCVLLALLNNISIKKTGLYLIHNRLADLFYDQPSSILWYTIAFLFLLRITIPSGKGASCIRWFSSLTLGIFILHPLLLTAIQTFYTPAGTIHAIILWAALVISSGCISFILLRIPFTKKLIQL